ncbi:hypothetical protein At15955_45470 (plasmid) [Agrobacterium tumefaciens]|nr:hypothetical protein Ach5_46150 [Agrobacterium tumefaciens]AYM19532.1 hypothetical protein At15955_45470 [Agrobacterium tumefaciens]AYM70833.1 hypothetical protein AtA6_46170 [Agrobacterium tumefaciens]
MVKRFQSFVNRIPLDHVQIKVTSAPNFVNIVYAHVAVMRYFSNRCTPQQSDNIVTLCVRPLTLDGTQSGTIGFKHCLEKGIMRHRKSVAVRRALFIQPLACSRKTRPHHIPSAFVIDPRIEIDGTDHKPAVYISLHQLEADFSRGTGRCYQ